MEERARPRVLAPTFDGTGRFLIGRVDLSRSLDSGTFSSASASSSELSSESASSSESMIATTACFLCSGLKDLLALFKLYSGDSMCMPRTPSFAACLSVVTFPH